MDLGISARLRPILDEVKRFIENEIVPLEHEFFAEVDKGDRWSFTPRQTEILETLKSKARERGLWNFFLTGHEDGHGLNTVEYAYIAEETGKSHLAPEACNCRRPTPATWKCWRSYGSAEQKKVAATAAGRRDPLRPSP